jgi:hypothetical protein
MGESIHVTLTPGSINSLGASRERPITLVLDGSPVPGIVATEEEATPEGEHLRFNLERTGENRAAWARLLGKGRGHHVLVTVEGPGGRADRKPHAATVSFKWFGDQKWIVATLIMLVAFLMIFIPVFNTTMYRDGGTGLPIDKATLYQFGTFSLARLQMGFWFLNVVVVYTSVWAMTGATDAISDSILAIIGIGSSTALGAALIDQASRDDLQKKRDAYRELYAKTNKTPEEQAALEALAKTLSSQGFLKDILTDERGWSFHRVQLVIWTCVIAIIFWSSAIQHYAMPDFDGTMLALMGISSGTYLGFKFPENSSAPRA